MDQLIFDNLSGQYIRLIPENKLPEDAVKNCQRLRFKYSGWAYVEDPTGFVGIFVNDAVYKPFADAMMKKLYGKKN